MKNLFTIISLVSLLIWTGCNDENEDPTDERPIQLSAARIGTVSILSDNEVGISDPLILTFSEAIDTTVVDQKVSIVIENTLLPYSYAILDEGKTISIQFNEFLAVDKVHLLQINEWEGLTGGLFPGASISFKTKRPLLAVTSLEIDGQKRSRSERIQEVSINPGISLSFNGAVDPSLFAEHLSIKSGGQSVALNISAEGDSTLSVTTQSPLAGYKRYLLEISGQVDQGQDFDFTTYGVQFYTEVDSTLKFELISDEELMTKVQEQTFKYFWDFGHPVSGLSRERNTSGETVTSGGSGFGLMAIIVGIERGFITRTEGIQRLETIIDFLGNADRFHGAWSHWLNGSTGNAIPFSANDDGGDLVETAFLVQGLLTVRQYLDDTDPSEAEMITKINTLWESVEWDWYTQGGQDVLYWHWSPNFGWEKNHRIAGWNEALAVYVLAAGSPTHTIDKSVYDAGWARNGNMVNGNNATHYGYTMPLRSDRGGPLFFAHYSFLGIDPSNLEDQYANYWTQNVNHTLINRAYCIDNPRNFVGYNASGWGLTASDNHEGYNAHSPDNDQGVITPTAALSSIPYTPEESMEAMRFFYYILGDRLWGEYGFYDAYNVTEGWTANSYIAIDQGPIIIMIENHRTGLLWDLLMSAPEVQNGLTKLGFTY